MSTDPDRDRPTGEEGVGLFEPDIINPPDFDRLDVATIRRLEQLSGLAATVSDALDTLGWLTSVSASALIPRHSPGRTVVGHAQTLSYMPLRRHVLHPGQGQTPYKLAHDVVYRQATPGDVMVIEAPTENPISVLGGIAAQTAVEHGLAAVVVDGAVRDIDQIRHSGLALWSRALTPRAGKLRMEAVAVNLRVRCGGVQVVPGDLVIADDTGLCFVPAEVRETVIDRVFEISEAERLQVAEPPPEGTGRTSGAGS